MGTNHSNICAYRGLSHLKQHNTHTYIHTLGYFLFQHLIVYDIILDFGSKLGHWSRTAILHKMFALVLKLCPSDMGTPQSGGCHPETLESALLCIAGMATLHSTHTEAPNLDSTSFGNWFNTSGVITLKIRVQNVGQVHSVRPSARCAHIWLCRFSLAFPSG